MYILSACMAYIVGNYKRYDCVA